MRLDKYLKVTGLIPRRTVANAACDAGRVQLNGRPAKAAAEVQVGDRIAFDLGRGAREVEVVEVPSGNVSRERRTACYLDTDAHAHDETGGPDKRRRGSEGSP